MSRWKSRWSRVRLVKTPACEAKVVCATKRQRVGRHFDHDRARATGHHVAQQALQVRRFRRRPGRVGLMVSDAIADSTDTPAHHPGGLEDGGQKVGGRRLAVRAGHADERELAARISIENRRERRDGEPRVTHLHPGRTDPWRRVCIGHDNRGSARDRVTSELGAIRVHSAQRDEHGTGFDRTRVVRDCGHVSTRDRARQIHPDRAGKGCAVRCAAKERSEGHCGGPPEADETRRP